MVPVSPVVSPPERANKTTKDWTPEVKRDLERRGGDVVMGERVATGCDNRPEGLLAGALQVRVVGPARQTAPTPP